MLSLLPPSLGIRYLYGTIGLFPYFLRKSEASNTAEDAKLYLTELQGEIEKIQTISDLLELLLREVQGRDGVLSKFQKKSGSNRNTDIIDVSIPDILTMHGCKGLEYDAVYVPDLNEGIMPPRKSDSESSIEEERRLLYVACTRAANELYLSYIKGTPESPRRSSRFLNVFGIIAYGV